MHSVRQLYVFICLFACVSILIIEDRKLFVLLEGYNVCGHHYVLYFAVIRIWAKTGFVSLSYMSNTEVRH